ncbi:TonB-dependent receptor [Colwellia echini]|uniref:TonB-dependent receptor n=1 Tax=Colwellia echini TaxID=1982103 RepID=A0ABY3MXD0_9GAMM|nr:TonB-dependent receptor [Colwellia echini]TYK65856.1 TonB-dependent receptor [Colwellia echini]
MINFKPSKLTLAIFSSGLMALSSQSIAAEDFTPDTQTEKEIETIEVSGIRGSLQRAQAIKMSSESIVEVLSAVDIGKLPDTSVAESLARLPGVTGERRNGRTSGLSIRGFNENYIGTLLNGRELLGMGDNRGVEFDLYPTEIVANILIYKTAEAGLMNQGIAGTIDLQTASPLNSQASMTVNAVYEQNEKESANPDYDNNGHRLSFNYIDQFFDDTLGINFVVSSQETPRQEENFRGWGYADTPDGDKILGGHDSFVRSALMERNSIATVIEYQPTDQLTVKFDALYIDFEENDVRRGLEEGGPVWGGVNYEATSIEDDLVTSGYWDGFYSVVRNDARSQESELTTFGLNVAYEINSDWTAMLDVSVGDVDKSLTDLESYSGVGRAGTDGRTSTARSWEMTSSGAMYSAHPTLPGVDFTDESLMRLAGPQSWGAPVIGSDAQDGFVNRPEFTENLDSIRIDIDGVVDYGIISGINMGVNYSERSKDKVNEGDYLTSPEYPGDAAIPNVLGIADLGFIGINGVLAYDSLDLYRSGYYTATEASLVQTDRLGDTYTINEETLNVYAKINLAAEFWGIYMSGNLGVQYVDVTQGSTGFSTVEDENAYVVSTATSGGASYSDWLPMLNLNFEVAEDQFIRTALAKVQSRPRMDDLRPNSRATFAYNDNQIQSANPDNGPWTGSAGNPELASLASNQFDISYENYFTDDGFFSAAFFYKDLTNWHRTSDALTDFSEVYIPEIHQDSNGDAPATLQGLVSTTTDGFEGFVRGYEFQASVPLRVMTDALDGFGVVMSATFLDGKLSDGSRVPGLSEESYSLTAYYEMHGFEFRIAGTKRSEFLTETRGSSLALQATDDAGAELWDAQISYDFAESGFDSLDGLIISLQGQNLTNENTVQAEATDMRQITSYQSFGANYSLGLNYTF